MKILLMERHGIGPNFFRHLWGGSKSWSFPGNTGCLLHRLVFHLFLRLFLHFLFVFGSNGELLFFIAALLLRSLRNRLLSLLLRLLGRFLLCGMWLSLGLLRLMRLALRLLLLLLLLRLLIAFKIIHILKLFVHSYNSVVVMMVIVGQTAVVFRRRLHLNLLLGQHNLRAERLQKLQEVFEMRMDPIGDGLTAYVVEIVFDKFGYEIDDPLYLLASRHLLVLSQPEEMDDGFGEDDLAYLEVDLLVLEDLHLVYPPLDAHVLEDVDGQVDDLFVLGPLGVGAVALLLLHLIAKIYLSGICRHHTDNSANSRQVISRRGARQSGQLPLILVQSSMHSRWKQCLQAVQTGWQPSFSLCRQIEQTVSPSTSSTMSSNWQCLPAAGGFLSIGQSLQQGSRRASCCKFSNLCWLILCSTAKPPSAKRQYFLLMKPCRNWMKTIRVSTKCMVRGIPKIIGIPNSPLTQQYIGCTSALVQYINTRKKQEISMTAEMVMQRLMWVQYLRRSMVGMRMERKCWMDSARKKRQQQPQKEVAHSEVGQREATRQRAKRTKLRERRPWWMRRERSCAGVSIICHPLTQTHPNQSARMDRINNLSFHNGVGVFIDLLLINYQNLLRSSVTIYCFCSQTALIRICLTHTLILV